MVRFGKRLALAREKRGITQERLAAELGIARASLGRWEGGDGFPSGLLLACRMAKALNVNVAWLAGESDDMGPPIRLNEQEMANYRAYLALSPSEREQYVKFTQDYFRNMGKKG